MRFSKVLIVAAVAVSGCGTQAGSSTPATVDEQLPAVDDPISADSAEWAEEGERLLADKRAAFENVPEGYDPENTGDYAVASAPIDIVKPGEYWLEFDVSRELDFNFPEAPRSVSMNPPPDTGFLYTTGDQRMRKTESGRIFEMQLFVEETEFKPYEKFWVWIY